MQPILPGFGLLQRRHFPPAVSSPHRKATGSQEMPNLGTPCRWRDRSIFVHRAISSTPINHRWRFFTICGSNVPARSQAR